MSTSVEKAKSRTKLLYFQLKINKKKIMLLKKTKP